MWRPPNLTLRWGDYFRPAADEEQLVVTMVVAAKDAGIITKRSAVEKLARAFGIEDVNEYLEALDEEAKQRQADAMAIAQAAPGKPNEEVSPVPNGIAGRKGNLPK